MPASGRRKLLILVVDDEPILRALACKMFEALGHRCIEAEDGERAVALCDDRVDLVLLDIVMPGIDGLEACRRMRARQGPRTLPIWFLTGTTYEGQADDVARAGGDGVLAKPVSRANLERLIAEVIPEGR